MNPNGPLLRPPGPNPLPTNGCRSRAVGLRCGACGAQRPLAIENACPECLGPLAVSYDWVGLRTGRGGRPDAHGLARYAELLPPVPDPDHAYALEGTPLRPAPRLARELGIAQLFLKDDTVLPTGSFKDRPATVAVAQAVYRGARAVGCASTGNLAAATARAAARAGLPAFVFVPVGLPAGKLDVVRSLGARIVEVTGAYDRVNRVAALAAEELDIAFVNIGLRPYYAEGSKTAWYETLDALGGETPDRVVLPLGSGALLAATGRAIEETRTLGWFRSGSGVPALVGSQPEGCAPIVEAFRLGRAEIRPVKDPHGIAESLAIGDPASGPEALHALAATGGTADAPTDAEVRDGIRQLARLEGIWVEPAGGTVVATLARLRRSGFLRSDDRIVAYLTGAGWKDPSAGTIAPVPSLRIDAAAPDFSELKEVVRGRSEEPATPSDRRTIGGLSAW
ncbi:MAG: threonine synthase [Thermoplasmata archaeon]